MSSSVALVCGLGARDDKGVSLNARVFGAEKPIPSRCAIRWRQLSTWSISAQSNGQRELTRDRSGGDRLSPGRGQYIRYICGANHYASRPNPVPRDHQYPRDGEHNSQMALQNHRGGCLRAVSPGYRSGYAASVIRRVRTFQAFTAFVASRNDTHAPPTCVASVYWKQASRLMPPLAAFTPQSRPATRKKPVCDVTNTGCDPVCTGYDAPCRRLNWAAT